jgi:hypothetical protein
MSLARSTLAATHSTADVMIHLGIGRTMLHELIFLGRRHKGCHPLKGGLWPTFKVSHRNRRISDAALRAHLAHMERLESDPMFAAEMGAKARAMARVNYGRPAARAMAA